MWRFAPETVGLVPTLAQQTAASPIVHYVPLLLVNTTFLDTALWQWIALLAVALVLTGLGRLLSRLLLALLRPGIARIAPRLNWSEVHAFVAPLQLLLIAALFRAGMAAIGSSAIVRFYLERLLSLLSIFAIAWLCVRIVDAAMIPVRGALAARRRTITHSDRKSVV